MTEHFKRQEERASKRAGGEEDYDEGKHQEALPVSAKNVYVMPLLFYFVQKRWDTEYRTHLIRKQ
jgi:hypothetical protein